MDPLCRMLLKIVTIFLLKDNLFTSAASISNEETQKLINVTTERVFYVYPVTSSPVSIVYPSVDISYLNFTENTSFSRENQSAIGVSHNITLSDDPKVLTDITKNEGSSSTILKNEQVTSESIVKIDMDENKLNVIEDNINVNGSMPGKFTEDHLEMKTNINSTNEIKEENTTVKMQIITINGMEDYTPLNQSYMKTNPIFNKEMIDKSLTIEKFDAPIIVMSDQIPMSDNKTKINLDLIPFTTDDVVIDSMPQKLQQNSSSSPTTNQNIDEIELDTDASDIIYDIEEIEKLLPSSEKKVFFKSTDIHPDNPYFKNIDKDVEKDLYIQLQDENVQPLKEVIELPPGSYASVWSGKVVEVKQDEPGDYDFHRHNNLLIHGLIPKPLVLKDSFKEQLDLPTAEKPSPFM